MHTTIEKENKHKLTNHTEHEGSFTWKTWVTECGFSTHCVSPKTQVTLCIPLRDDQTMENPTKWCVCEEVEFLPHENELEQNLQRVELWESGVNVSSAPRDVKRRVCWWSGHVGKD